MFVYILFFLIGIVVGLYAGFQLGKSAYAPEIEADVTDIENEFRPRPTKTAAKPAVAPTPPATKA